MITDEPLSIEGLLAVVAGARVELGAAARTRIEAGRAVVERVLASGEAVYGLTTGIGHMRDVRLSDEDLRRQQEFIVTTHAGGIGPPLPRALVRAAMAVRLNGIARGGSGASPAVADVLAAMLNAGVHPVVPETGSVGAGDLGQMAYLALVAIGRGSAEHGGSVVPGGEALALAGIAPIELQPKDGLALVSANGISVGHAALVVARAEALARAADVVAAVSLEAARGNPSIVLPAVAAAKPYPGQIDACRAMRAALAGSELLAPGAPRSVQDALSFRVAPQVHGALREMVAFARRAVETELNSQSDNPLVSVEDGTIVSNGNFHPIVLALAADALRVALAHVGQLSERRTSQLWDAFFARMAERGPDGSDDGAPPALFGLSLRYPAAARFAELKQLAAPATLDVPPLDIGVEDHSTAAPLAVRKADESVSLLGDVLTCELLLARDVFGALPERAALGAGTGRLVAMVDHAAACAEEPSPAAVHRAVRAGLEEMAGAGEFGNG
jgi:histidine ammonia-lyase